MEGHTQRPDTRPIEDPAERPKISLAKQGGIHTRVLRLTLLSPDIVEAILDGKQGPEVTLAQVLEPSPAEWEAQRRVFA